MAHDVAVVQAAALGFGDEPCPQRMGAEVPTVWGLEPG